MPNEPATQTKVWDAMAAYILKRLETDNPFEMDAKQFQKELGLSDDFQLILLNARDGRQPTFEMKILSVLGDRQVLRFWK